MSNECGNCSGPRREACINLREDYREKLTSPLNEAIEAIVSDDMVSLMNSQAEMSQKNASLTSETFRAMRELGCTLEPMQAQQFFMSEVSAAVTLFALEKMEEAIQEEAKIDEEIENILKRIDRGPNTSQKDFSKVPDRAEEIEQILAVRKQAAIEEYCAQQDWDSNNLDFSKKLEVQSYLKTIGFSK